MRKKLLLDLIKIYSLAYLILIICRLYKYYDIRFIFYNLYSDCDYYL